MPIFYKDNVLNEAFQSTILSKISKSSVFSPKIELNSYSNNSTVYDLSKLLNKKTPSLANQLGSRMDFAKITDDDFEGPLDYKSAVAILKNNPNYVHNYYGFWFNKNTDEYVMLTVDMDIKRIFKKEKSLSKKNLQKMIKDGVVSKESFNGEKWRSIEIPNEYITQEYSINAVNSKEYKLGPARLKEYNLDYKDLYCYLVDSNKTSRMNKSRKRDDIRKGSMFGLRKSEYENFLYDFQKNNRKRYKDTINTRISQSYKDPLKDEIALLVNDLCKYIKDTNIAESLNFKEVWVITSAINEVKSIIEYWKSIYNEIYRMANGYSLYDKGNLISKEHTIKQKIKNFYKTYPMFKKPEIEE